MKNELSLIIRASAFAALYHSGQYRKGMNSAPYVTHPLEVSRILLEEGGITDVEVLAAAILHDTIEDTKAEADQIKEQFGERVCSLVLEVTDDKGLLKQERKRLQVVNAPKKTMGAAAIKLADKIANVRDITYSPPDWEFDRKNEYMKWATEVVGVLPACNDVLKHVFDNAIDDFYATVRS